MASARLYKFYTGMPVALQNLALTAAGYRERRVRYGRTFRELLAAMTESQWASADEVRAHQDERVRWVVRHAYDTVPFYRRLYDTAGVAPHQVRGVEDLVKLPLVTKEMVRAAGADMLSTACRRGDVKVVLTSGTSGTPLKVFRTRRSIAWQWAVWWRHRARFGLAIDDPFLMVGARVPIDAGQRRPPFWREDYANHRVYLSAYHLGPAQMPHVADMLRRRRFRFYTGYPSAIAQICDYLVGQRVDLPYRPDVVVTGSDALLPAFERRIREALGVPVTDQYGMAEFCGNYARCEHGAYHLDHECCHAELLPMPGTEGRSIVFTGWGNEAMPFIRYVTGDHGRPPADGAPCPCGRSTPRLAAVDGRLEDYVYTPDGRKLMGMNQVLEYAVGAREIQVRQESLRSVTVCVVPGHDYDDAATRAALTREFDRRRGGADLRIEFALVDHIPREPNGKFRAVLSRVRDGSESGEAVRAALAADRR